MRLGYLLLLVNIFFIVFHRYRGTFLSLKTSGQQCKITSGCAFEQEVDQSLGKNSAANLICFNSAKPVSGFGCLLGQVWHHWHNSLALFE